MMPQDFEPHKVRWCKPRRSALEWQLERTGGECLEEVGVPREARAVINHTTLPRVGDLVHCNTWLDSIHGYIKQVKEFDGDVMKVGTRYLDHSRNFDFYATTYYGVVEMVFDLMGNIVYRRSTNGTG